MMLLQHAPCQPIATTRSDSPAATAILTVSGQHRRCEVADNPVDASGFRRFAVISTGPRHALDFLLRKDHAESLMTASLRTSTSETAMSAMDAIFHRRAVRDYAPQRIEQTVIRILLDAAVHAPTAMDEEAWAFAVIQDGNILKRLSDDVKSLMAKGTDSIHPLLKSHASDRLKTREFNAFYNAGTLVVICGKPLGPFVVADCWLAAENLMLAACAAGLGTCPIGLAVEVLNTPQWKKELGVTAEMTVIAPIIVGLPAGETPPVPRKPPQVLCWK